MPIKPQLHQSHLSTLAKCGVMLQFRYGYTLDIGERDIILPPNIALARGTAVHKAVQANLQNKIDTGHLLKAQDVSQVAFESAQKLWDNEISLRPDEEVDKVKTQGEFLDSTVELSTLHAMKVAPNILPVEVEKGFVITMNNYPFDLSGQIDVVEGSPRIPDALAIRDTKTSGKKPAADAARSLQIAMYSQAIKVETGQYPETASLDYLVKTKSKTEYVCCETTDVASLVPALDHRINQAAELFEAVRKGHSGFTPADPDHWICSAKFCGYHKICPFYSGK